MTASIQITNLLEGKTPEALVSVSVIGDQVRAEEIKAEVSVAKETKKVPDIAIIEHGGVSGIATKLCIEGN